MSKDLNKSKKISKDLTKLQKMSKEVSKNDSNFDSNGGNKLSKKLIYMTAFLTVCLTGLGQIPPNPWGGFYCDDVSIKVQRGLDTMPTVWLFVFLLFPTVLVMYLVEKISDSSVVDSDSAKDSTSKSFGNGLAVHKRSGSPQRHEGPWKKAKSIYGQYLVGLLMTTCFNEVTKVLVAEPRPHFIETCNPDMTTGACSQQSTPNSFVYYSDISCQGPDTAGYGVPRRVTDSMKSFPSGHAQLAAYSAVFMIIYLQSHSSLGSGGVAGTSLRIISIIFFICFALVASVSRILDHRHHWWDVLAGDIFGISTAILMKVFYCPQTDTRIKS